MTSTSLVDQGRKKRISSRTTASARGKRQQSKRKRDVAFLSKRTRIRPFVGNQQARSKGDPSNARRVNMQGLEPRIRRRHTPTISSEHSDKKHERSYRPYRQARKSDGARQNQRIALRQKSIDSVTLGAKNG